MKIGGLQKLSLIDYPERMAAVIFVQGCPFRCHFCHNPSLVLKNRFTTPLEEVEILSFLKTRKKMLDAVVISGGEPTTQEDLLNFITKLKSYGYLVKVDTSGFNPAKLEELLEVVDYVAMDLKAPLTSYSEITGVKIDVANIKKSIKLLLSWNKSYEFRTTLIPSFHSEEVAQQMAEEISGANLYILQRFVPKNVLNPSLSKIKPFCEEELLKFKFIVEKFVKYCYIR